MCKHPSYLYLNTWLKKANGFKCPMNRVAEPEEIINVVLFVSSDKASFVTGQVLAVDGAFVL